MNSVSISPALANAVGVSDVLPVPGKSIEEILDNLVADYPELDQSLTMVSGKLPRYIRIFVNSRPVKEQQFKQELSEPINLSVVAAVAGG